MILVLRLGHRVSRDQRVSTHVGLVARALGADGIVFSGERDEKLIRSLKGVVERWGGPFTVEYREDWRWVIKEWKGVKVHLTMYGLPFEEVVPGLRGKDVLVVVGAEKVPADVYSLVDYNVSVGNQPHSEIAALALFLDRLTEGKWLERKFEGGRLEIVPSERGKRVIEK